MVQTKTCLLYLTLAMILLGLVCCITLGLRMLREMKAERCQRLLRCQLLSLSVAGFVEYLTGPIVPMIDLSLLPPSFGQHTCVPMYTVFRTFRTIVIFQQTQVAVAFFAQCVKWTSLLSLLYQGVWILWIIGGLIGFVNTLFLEVAYNPEHGTCEINKNKKNIGEITVLCLCLFVCAIASISTFISSVRLPFKVARANYRRAIWFPLVNIVTYTMPMVAYWYPPLLWDPAWFWPAAMLVEMSNFPLTAGVFLLLSWCARREGRGHRGDGEQPLGADALSTSVVRDALSTSGCSDIRELVDFHVNFGGVQVVDVCVPDEPESTVGALEAQDASPGEAPSRSGSFHSTGSARSSQRQRERIQVKVVGESYAPGLSSAFTIAVAKGSARYTVYRRVEDLGELERALRRRAPGGTRVPVAPKDRCTDAVFECFDEERFHERRRSAVEDFLRGCLALEDQLGMAFRELQVFLSDQSFQGAVRALQRQR